MDYCRYDCNVWDDYAYCINEHADLYASYTFDNQANTKKHTKKKTAPNDVIDVEFTETAIDNEQNLLEGTL